MKLWAAALSLIAGLALAQPSTLTVTYLANEGFLLEGGGGKVLVDALFGAGLSGYPVVPSAVRKRLEAAEAPFDDVDLVLATHFHGDHFDAAAVRRFLQASPGTLFVSTHQAVSRLREAGFTNERQLAARLPAEGEVEALSAGSVQLQIFNLHHGRDRRPPVENLGFLITVADQRVLHIGDTEVTVGDVAALQLASRQIDIALLPVWFLTYPEWMAVTRTLEAGQIIGMHLAEPTASARYFGPEGSYEGRLARIEKEFPSAQVATEPGARYRFNRRP